MEYEITQIDDTTWTLSEGFVRFFLLAGKNEALLIDTGMNVGKALEAAKSLTSLPVRLINTHADPDHISGNKDFTEVMMHPSEKENYVQHGAGGGNTKIIPVADGQIIDPGERPLQVVWIPGHTPGSIGILDINRRYFFSGDTVQQGSEIFMFGPQRNLSDFVASLEKLQKMSDKFDLIFACHGALSVKPSVISELITGAKKVLAGEIKGEPREMFGTKIQACDVGCDILLVGDNFMQSLPLSIRSLVFGKSYLTDSVGKSGSGVYIFDDSVLKILDAHEKQSREKNDLSVKVMRWLDGKLPVPKVLCYEADEDFQYLLMSRVTGKMSCDESYLEHPRKLCRLLAQAFKMLWSVDITGCPRERTIENELEEAKYRVENNLVDVDDAEPETFGANGFENPEALLAWLQTHKPEYEPVLSHGDFCLPNIFLQDNQVTGFIDLGATGIGDKWRDIALCHRSLKHNCDGTFGGKVYPDFNPDFLFEELGLDPNSEKIRYYILLDELF